MEYLPISCRKNGSRIPGRFYLPAARGFRNKNLRGALKAGHGLMYEGDCGHGANHLGASPGLLGIPTQGIFSGNDLSWAMGPHQPATPAASRFIFGGILAGTCNRESMAGAHPPAPLFS